MDEKVLSVEAVKNSLAGVGVFLKNHGGRADSLMEIIAHDAALRAALEKTEGEREDLKDALERAINDLEGLDYLCSKVVESFDWTALRADVSDWKELLND